MKKMRERKILLKTFVISAFIMAIPMMATLFLFRDDAQPISIISKDIIINENIPTITTMMALTSGGTVSSFVLMQIDVSKSAIKLSVLPSKLLLEEGGEQSTLSTIWEERGGLSTIRLMSDMLDIPINRFSNISEDSLVKIVDMIGTVDMVIESEMLGDISDEWFVEGRQLLDGRRLLFLSNEGDTDFMLKFITELLVQHLEKISSRTMNIIFNEIVNSGKNNLSITDYTMRENEIFRISDDFIVPIKLDGALTKDKTAFILHAKSLEDIAKWYNANPRL